jgi:hypothetical protein
MSPCSTNKEIPLDRNNLGIIFVSLAMLSGCAASNPALSPAPMPVDIGWSTPRVETPDELPQHTPPVRPASPVEKLVSCEDGSPVKVNVGVTSGLALQFDPDVYVVEVKGAYEEWNPVDDKDPPWKVVIGKSGSKYPMVYLAATRPGMTTSFMIPTSKGLCLVDARSVTSSRVRVVRLTHKVESTQPVVPKPQWLPDPTVAAVYHGGYTIDPPTGGPVWRPSTVVDNGRRTFIIFPRNLSVMSAPMARMVGANGPEMINPVLVDHVMVLDHLVPMSLELRLGSGEQAEVVRIVRGSPQRIECPGNPACPVWSERMAGR